MAPDDRDTILIFRLGSIGDTVVALPCFHAIARAFPQHRRVLLTDSVMMARASSVESVLQGSGLIDEVIYYPVGDFTLRSGIKLVRELRRVRAARMIYLAERKTAGPVYRDLLFFKIAGMPKIAGYPGSRNLRACSVDPVTHELEYEAERLARMLRRVVPVSLAWPNWDLRLSPVELAAAADALAPVATSSHLLAIAPGAKVTVKDWGVDNWCALLKELAPSIGHVPLVIVGASDERLLGDTVSRDWPGPAVNLCGMLTPRETAAVLGRCSLLICHDSGPMHLAASQNTPCVALFGNNNQPHQWFPFGSGHRVIHEARGLKEITVHRVAREVQAALGQTTHAEKIGAAVG